MAKQRTGQQLDLMGIFVDDLDRHILIERFEKRPQLNAAISDITTVAPTIAQMTAIQTVNVNWEVLGANMTSALCTHADGGGITMTSAAGDAADACVLTPHLDTSVSSWATTKWNTMDQIAFATKVKMGASIADAEYAIGFKLTNTTVTATDADQAFFRYETAVSAYWQCVYSYDGTDVTFTTDKSPVASGSNRLQLIEDSDRKVHFFIDGECVYIGAKAMSSGTASAGIDLLIPYVSMLANTTSARAITVRKVICSKLHND